MSHGVQKTEPKFRRDEFELFPQQPEQVYIRPLDSFVNRPVDSSEERSVDSSRDRLVDPSEERPVDPSRDISVNSSGDRSVDASENRSVNSSDVAPVDVPAYLSDASHVETFTTRPDSLFSCACQNSLANNLITFIMVLFIVGILLMFILLPLSLADLEYYEMGFVKNKITGSVDTEKVYYGGRHFIGLAKTFKIFPFNLHTERFPYVSIYNKEKIEVTLSCSLQYALKAEDLHLLHDIYDVSYRPVLRAVILATIKGAATQYTIKEYRLKRRVVEQGLSDVVAKSLSGNCCPPNCSNNECKDCIPQKNCSANEKGLFASLKYFHLQHISVTKQQESIYLRQVLEQEKKHTEVYIQQEMLMRKRTDEKRIAIEMLTKELSQVAIAKSSLITSKAQVAAEARLNAARSHGLNLVYSALNISEEEKKLSFDYLRTLTDSTKAKLFLDFQYMVAEP